MNASLMAHAGYAATNSSIRTPRSIEYDVFAKATTALRKAESASEKAHAIADNRALWTILATEVADPQNGLPKELRARIFYLSEFVTHHSSRVLRGEIGTEALIDVNTTIMSGLRQTSARAA
ncbi:flagellar biosynthesis regulatory protein FlaF [Rhodobacteraceae bacterium THAF1]|uniref:flagellar biosynthesis regulator FlaF n=1 Tax=Palleronia sp. THAF1 TaxID=2587842 RepID=UPI000F3ECFA3|nr:flagellar biosynthesis regulator FlaF [Palleronia sp. THAF1]QFU10295.1 flagellar biosynthesis regulatory protein FlaF [Palleronia sp. THAF1]VDC16800.1 flagellar biosynthesis regulatory protein FlaF [Rhodobacteraceae bacterium THAF1]